MTKSLLELEKDYYPVVERWLAQQYNCFQTGINTGLVQSRADVVGVRDVGGDFSGEIETIIVEVKRNKEPFATASGQTFGYTVYANRVYLADKRENGFTQDEIMIANHLGIGLIQIDKNDKCSEILTSPYYKPLTKFSIEFLHKLKLAKCQFCETYFTIGNDSNQYANVTRENIKKAIEEERGIMFWQHKELWERKHKFQSEKRSQNLTYERRYLCSECTQLLFGQK